MANKTFNTRVKNKRDTAANWEAVATTFQPLDGELIIVDTSAGKTRFKVGRYDTAKGRLLYYNEIPFADEYLYNDLNESQGKIYDKLKGIDDKSIIEMTLESVFDNTKFVNYRIGLWQFPKTGFYKLNISKRGTTATQLFLYAQKTKEDGTTPEDPFSQDNLLRVSPLTGDKQVESVFVQVDYTDTDTLTVYKVQFLNVMTFPGTININTYNKTTQKWDFTSVTESSAKWANNATQVSNALTLTKGDTTTTFNGSTAQTVSIPTKTSELTNDSNFTTQTDLDNLTNTVVSYNAQENITDEQKATARTNIGAISEAELIQPDWNQNDATASDYIKNKPTIDTALSSTSENAIQNKAVKTAIDSLQTAVDSKVDITTLNYGLTKVTNSVAANYVKFTAEQTLTDEQKAQARDNINAPSPADAVYTATAASTDGVAYTATVSGIDSLTVGASFIMIPNKASTSKAPTLNVNGLGAKPIRRRLSSLTTSLQQGYSTNWIALNKPFTVVYDGTAWVIEGLTKTDGADVYGAVAQATADAKGNNIADTYATIAMLQSLLPKVTTITLTSNWVGDASPYYQDIALSCVTETSIVDLQPTPEQLNSWQDDGIAFTTLSGNGTVRVYVAGGKPSSAISVQIRVQEVTVI